MGFSAVPLPKKNRHNGVAPTAAPILGVSESTNSTIGPALPPSPSLMSASSRRAPAAAVHITVAANGELESDAPESPSVAGATSAAETPLPPSSSATAAKVSVASTPEPEASTPAPEASGVAS